MIEKSLNPSYKLRANIRPFRIAYFIPSGDGPALEKLIHLVCTQWGGKNHLIIPVNPHAPEVDFYIYLLRLFDPDWFVCYFGYDEKYEETRAFINKYLKKIFQRPINLEMGEFFEKHDQTAHALHVIPEDVLRGSGSDYFTTYKYIKGAENQLQSLALFGGFYPGQEEFYRGRPL
jgi:hypothetical protein